MHLRGQPIPQLAVVEAQWLELQEAEVLDTDWATTGISFLKGVQLLVHPIPPPAHHHLRTAGTGTAATKGTDAGMEPFLLLSLVIVVFLHPPSSNVLLFVSCQ